MTRREAGSDPFRVLDLDPRADPVEVERQGARLLGLLKLGVASAALYETPDGVEERTPDRVREALATLRDPNKRLLAEIWHAAPPARHTSEPRADAPWPGVLRRLGLER